VAGALNENRALTIGVGLQQNNQTHMARKKRKVSWDDVGVIDSRFLPTWGAFEPGRCDQIELEGEGLKEPATYICDNDGRGFTLIYAWHDWQGDVNTVRCHVELTMIMRGLGREAVFRCPDCGRKCQVLAVRRFGLQCAKCGPIVWGSTREGKVARLVRRANIVCQKLGLASWAEQPMRKPKYMTARRYVSLLDQRATVLSRIRAELGKRRRFYGALPMHRTDYHSAVGTLPANFWSHDYRG
jgi:hypothetical protein